MHTAQSQSQLELIQEQLAQKHIQAEQLQSELMFAQNQILSLQARVAQLGESTSSGIKELHESLAATQRALEEQREHSKASEAQVTQLSQKLSFLEDSLRQKEREWADVVQMKEADVYEFERQKEEEFIMLAPAKDSVASQLSVRDGTTEKVLNRRMRSSRRRRKVF